MVATTYVLDQKWKKKVFPLNPIFTLTLRKHVHMIYCNFFRSKIDDFQRKIFDIFLIFAQNITCGYTLEPPRRGGSNEYPQSMFRSKNKKKRYPGKPQFYYIKVGYQGIFVAWTCFADVDQNWKKKVFPLNPIFTFKKSGYMPRVSLHGHVCMTNV